MPSERLLTPQEQTFKMAMSALTPISSAFGGKADEIGVKADIQNGDVRFDPDFVCFTPECGPFLRVSQTSEVDPKRTWGNEAPTGY